MSQQSRPIPGIEPAIDYRHEMISSRRVEGTPVYNRSDQRLGTIHSVMIEKVSGQVTYAVLSFGGIFGVGGRVTWVFDKAGVVRMKFDSKVRFGKHVDEALETVKKLV